MAAPATQLCEGGRRGAAAGRLKLDSAPGAAGTWERASGCTPPEAGGRWARRGPLLPLRGVADGTCRWRSEVARPRWRSSAGNHAPRGYGRVKKVGSRCQASEGKGLRLVRGQAGRATGPLIRAPGGRSHTSGVCFAAKSTWPGSPGARCWGGTSQGPRAGRSTSLSAWRRRGHGASIRLARCVGPAGREALPSRATGEVGRLDTSVWAGSLGDIGSPGYERLDQPAAEPGAGAPDTGEGGRLTLERP